jgi:hypothetical protein
LHFFLVNICYFCLLNSSLFEKLMAPKTRPKRPVLVDPEHDEKLMSEDEEDEEDEDYVPEKSEDDSAEESEEEDSEESEEEEEEDEDDEEEEDEQEEGIKMKSKVFDLDGKGTIVCAFGLVLKSGDVLETTNGLRCVFSKLADKPNTALVHWLFPDKDVYIQGAETTAIPLVILQSKCTKPVVVDRVATGIKDLSYESSHKLILDGICGLEPVLDVGKTVVTKETKIGWTLEKQKELELFFRTVWPKLKNMYEKRDDSFYGQLFCKWANNNNEDAKSWILYKFNEWENAVLQMLQLDWEREVNQLVSL